MRLSSVACPRASSRFLGPRCRFEVIRTVGYTHKNGVGARTFLDTAQYKNLNRWADLLMSRPQVQRGMLVCRKHPKPWLVDDRFKHLANL